MNLSTAKVQIQKPAFSALLEKSIAMLILPHAELAGTIEQELQNNPLLDAEFQIPAEGTQDMKAFLNSFSHAPQSAVEEEERESFVMANMMTLEDHLCHQLFWEISDPQKREIGKFIIGNLDKDGFLHLTCEEIAQALNIPDIFAVKEVLRAIQNFDPLGIAARDFKDCLVIQLQARQSAHRELAIRIVEEYLDFLANKRHAALSKKLSVSIEQIRQAEFLISSLEPKPARNWGAIDPSIYVEPDVFIRKNEQGEYFVETNKNGLPVLRISQTYRNLLNQPNISNEDRDFIKEKITHAVNFIRNIQQRGETLAAIGCYILKRQKEFFDGEDSVLSPLTLKDAAFDLERCESTISRAISNKYIDTPQGLFPLKFFFSHHVCRQNNKNVSAHNVKQQLARLIEDENKQSPLSDQDIQAYFDSQGLHLSRRTITKYRQTLHIPSSHSRK